MALKSAVLICLAYCSYNTAHYRVPRDAMAVAFICLFFRALQASEWRRNSSIWITVLMKWISRPNSQLRLRTLSYVKCIQYYSTWWLCLTTVPVYALWGQDDVTSKWCHASPARVHDRLIIWMELLTVSRTGSNSPLINDTIAERTLLYRSRCSRWDDQQRWVVCLGLNIVSLLSSQYRRCTKRKE